MKLLLDTHAFLFAIGAPKRLSKAARKALEEPANPRWISAASLWEIAAKIQTGKLDLPTDIAFYHSRLADLKANVLAVEPRHSFELFRLPLLHKDPFDRLLVAQAKVDELILVTRDQTIPQYDVPTLW